MARRVPVKGQSFEYIDASILIMEYLWEPISMSANDCHVSRRWVLVVKWRILLHSKFEFIVLAIYGRSWIFAYM
jgi:hypothetical protein